MSSELSRRDFLVRTGSGAVLLGGASSFDLAAAAMRIASLQGPQASLRLRLLRRADMLSLDVRFYNLKVVHGAHGPELRRIVASAPAYLSFGFPPQALGEEAYLDLPTPDPTPVPGTADVFLSGPSRLVFSLPASIHAVPFTSAALLDWSKWLPSLAPSARPTASLHPAIKAPAVTETAIEAPFRVIISPDPAGRWSHSPKPVTHANRTELWRTRLGRRVGSATVEPPAAQPAVRAIWTPGYPTAAPENNPALDRMALDRRTRVDLVANMSDWGLGGDDPTPAVADRLALSALGATMDVRGSWNRACTSLEAWRHKMSLGRETYVRVVRRGFLHPIGVRASLITITERKFDLTPTGGGFEAVLRQRRFIVVRQPVKDFGGENAPGSFQQHGGRKFPWRVIEFRTLTTPDLDGVAPPGAELKDPDPPNAVLGFFPTIAGVKFEFVLAGTDWDGQATTLSMPLAFVEAVSECRPFGARTTLAPLPPPGLAFDPVKMAALNAAYMALPDVDRTVQLAGQKLAMAPAAVAGSTTVQAVSAVLGAHGPLASAAAAALASADQPAFFPTLEQAAIQIPGLDALRGAVPGLGPTDVKLPDTFLEHGFPTPQQILDDLNLGGAAQGLVSQASEMFAEAVGSKLPFSLPGSGSGGVAIPGLDVGGISRRLGPVGDALGGLLQSGGSLPTFDPTQFFNPDAKILGVISLKDILSIVGIDFPGSIGSDVNKMKGEIDKLADSMPKLPVEIIYPGGDKTKLPEAVRTTLHYDTRVKVSEGEFAGFFEPDANSAETHLVLNAVIYTPLKDPAATTYDVLGELNDFKVNLFGSDASLQFFILTFRRIKFTSSTKAKPHLDVQLQSVDFGGALDFVKQLEQFLESTGGGLSIDVTPAGVKASFTLAIPAVSIGVFSLQNMALSFGFNLPFDTGKVRLRATFCTREHPFLLTVYVFGGGGFFGIALGLDGIELIEASLEFGACASLDLGVASGSVSIMAGIYFKLTFDSGKSSNVVELTGYVRANGELKVLGLITISVEFYLGLTYISPPGKAYGKASMTVKVEVLFFSQSVTITVEKQFAGGSDPTFAQMISSGDFDTYCGAFA